MIRKLIYGLVCIKYQEDGKIRVCDGESQIFIPFWIYIFVYDTSLQFLHNFKLII